MAVRICRTAQSRLLEVWDYTETTWGEEQADAYVRELVDAAHRLPDERHGWRPVKDRVFGEFSSSGIAIIISFFANWAVGRSV